MALGQDLLTEFNGGGSHESNPLGGIPQGVGPNGQPNLVEEGETRMGDFIFSDRLTIDEAATIRYNLPKNTKGKTFADASKLLNKHSKENVDSKIDMDTSKEMLERLQSANDEAKTLNETSPEGENINAYGGNMHGSGGNMYPYGGGVNSLNPYGINQKAPNIVGQVYNPASTGNPNEANSKFAGFGGIGDTAANAGGASGGGNQAGIAAAGSALGGIGDSLGGDFAERYNYDPKLKKQYESLENTKDSIAGAFGPFGQLFRGVEKAGKGVGTAIGGETGGDIASGILDPFSGQLETFKNKESTDLEKIGVIAAPFLSGVIAGGARKRAKAKIEQKKSARGVNEFYRSLAYGGNLSKGNMPYAYGNGGNMRQEGEPAFGYGDTNMYKDGGNLYKDGGKKRTVQQPVSTLQPFDISNLGYGPTQDPIGEEYVPIEYAEGYTPSFGDRVKAFGKTAKGKIGDNAELLRYAPIVANAYQLSKLKKPERETRDRIGRKYKPQFADEAAILNQANEAYGSISEALAATSGGDAGSLRSNLIAAGSQRARGLSDARLRAEEVNRNERTRGQQFDLNVDQFNVGQSNLEKDVNARNLGAYETQKSKLIGQLGQDIGNVGLEELRKKYPERMGLLYNADGTFNPEGYASLVALYNKQKKTKKRS